MTEKQEYRRLNKSVAEIAMGKFSPVVKQAYMATLKQIASDLGFDNAALYTERKPVPLRTSFQKDVFERDYWGDGECLYIIEVERDPRADVLSRCWAVSVWCDGPKRGLRLPKTKTKLAGVEALIYAAELQNDILPSLIEKAKKAGPRARQ